MFDIVCISYSPNYLCLSTTIFSQGLLENSYETLESLEERIREIRRIKDFHV